MSALCARCGKLVAGVAGDPVIAASSLGAGVYHERCAKERWQELRAEEAARAAEIAARRAAHARRVFGAST